MSNTITVDARGLDEAAKLFAATPEQAEKAMRAAVTRTSRWAAGEARRRVARNVKVSGTVLKGRMVIDIKADSGRVWIGLRPVPLKRLKPRRTMGGITAGPAKRPGAFIVKSLGGHVYERVGSARLPIRKSDGVEIFNEGAAALQAAGDQVEERLLKEFERALEWQTSK